jgi:hypothetical protein
LPRLSGLIPRAINKNSITKNIEKISIVATMPHKKAISIFSNVSFNISKIFLKS